MRFTQERMDRRTALMQAVQFGESGPNLWRLADDMYAWLRASDGEPKEPISRPVGAGGGTIADPIPAKPEGDKPAPASPPSERPEAKDGQARGEGAAVTPVEGGGTTDGGVVLPPIHVHTWVEAPRLGWSLCSECGTAKKRKVNVNDG